MAAAAAGPVVAGKETEVILPPRTAVNPVPPLPAALRIDNREQLLSFLQATATGRQALIFGTETLRTLLLRQVLSDPTSRVFKGKKNWDPITSFPLPRNLHIVRTHVLPSKTQLLPGSPSSSAFGDDFEDDDDVDYVTFFLKSSNLVQTMQVAQRIQAWKGRVHFRIAFLPQATALCHKVLSNVGLTKASNVSVHSIQLDVFPLESDVLSLEYEDALKETEVDGTPSSLITTMARALLKIQDVVGVIPRLQGLGPLAEEVIKKFMAIRLEEFQLEPDATYPGEGEALAMMVIDRKVDMVTPMLTPLTYEGLLDDVVGIDCG